MSATEYPTRAQLTRLRKRAAETVGTLNLDTRIVRQLFGYIDHLKGELEAEA
jgi:hypothetical protein